MTHFTQQIAKLEGQRELERSQRVAALARLGVLEERTLAIEEAQVLLQITAAETQDNLRVHLSDIVQSALDALFPGEYTFCIDFELKRGSTVCEMYLLDDAGFRTDPMTAEGGGVVDVIALSLRLAVWALSRPENVLVLDEPFKFLSANLRPAAADILSQMSTRLDLQIVMVTHDPVLTEVADRVFRVVKNADGRSSVAVVGA